MGIFLAENSRRDFRLSFFDYHNKWKLRRNLLFGKLTPKALREFL